ncbi:ABC transporter permease [Embleya sp. NBC_00896]|uniref:ABC transporter permease n=1 Tax=Embleya sp. NBC_00896 TaxID=2975961 RepID=UPI00386F4C2C|nr:ABC transporter permease [Embleya sp. NBC_00896]
MRKRASARRRGSAPGAARLPSPARLAPRDALAVGLGGLRGRRLRAVLSALGIAIGIGAMVAVVGIGASGQAEVTARIRSLGTNLLTAGPGQTVFGERARLPADADAMVERIGPVISASATGKVDATVRRTDRVDPNANGGMGVLAARDDLPGTVGSTMRSGRFLDPAVGAFPTVVLGSTSAERLGMDSPGGRVWLGEQWFTVVGILAPVPLAPELDVSALVGWQAARAHLSFDGAPTTVYTRARDARVEQVRAVLAATIAPASPNEVRVSRPSDALAAQSAAEDTLSSLLLGLGAVALLVGGVGVANTMVVAVLERRREIGLRRALGAHRGQIRNQFLIEAVCLSGLGGFAGVLLGALTTFGYAGSRGWPWTMPPGALGAAVCAAAVVGAMAGWYPASRAARLPPTEALASA